jgi:hypothetical protein
MLEYAKNLNAHAQRGVQFTNTYTPVQYVYLHVLA